ncbi:unnamed protein product [Lymnaea stagnalis]|uniref:TNFR-Cys domain-containing protein n=1 Tax=Lymnaea stagnalis TaxID=6523 RepID=A0AAV2I1E9_LYMST
MCRAVPRNLIHHCNYISNPGTLVTHNFQHQETASCHHKVNTAATQMDLFNRLSVNLCIGFCILAYKRTVLASTLDCRECAKTPTHPTCEKELYIKSAPGPECTCVCTPCDICGVGLQMYLDYERQECGEYSNTVCCSSSDMIVIDGACHPAPAVITGSTTHQSSDKGVTNPGNNGGLVYETKIITLIALMASFACAFNG